MSELERKMKSFKLEPQSKEQALASIKRLRKDLNLENAPTDKNRVKTILNKAGSLTDELLAMREQDRE